MKAHQVKIRRLESPGVTRIQGSVTNFSIRGAGK